MTAAKASVCFFSSTQYDPFDGATQRKMQMLSDIATVRVIGQTQRTRAGAPEWLLVRRRGFLPARIASYVFGASRALMVTAWQRKSDVVIAQGPLEGALAAVVRRMLRPLGRSFALVIEAHGDFEAVWWLRRGRTPGPLSRKVVQRLARFGINEASVLRAVSISTKEQLRRFRADAPIVVFPAYTELDPFLAVTPSVPHIPHFIFAGALTPLKGVHHLLEAFARVDVPARLTLVGSWHDVDYRRDMEYFIEQRGLGARVEVRAHTERETLAEMMASTTALVLPSTSEGLGRVVMEAMAAGKATIGSDVGGIPELIEHGRTGLLVKPGDVGALHQALKQLAGSAEQAAGMGVAARDRARREFGANRFVDGYADVISLALGRGAA